MQTNEKMVQQIVDILHAYVPDGLAIEADTELVADLDLDSLKVMKILESIEDSFDISIPISILPDIRTVADLTTEIQKLNGN